MSAPVPIDAIPVGTSAFAGFPTSLIGLVRCPEDGGALEIGDVASGSERSIQAGTLRCEHCSRTYRIANGILQMLEVDTLDAEEVHELEIRAQLASAPDTHAPDPSDEFWDRLEMPATLRALAPSADSVVLELACGTGRYTLKLLPTCRSMLAVDFSLESLKLLAQRIPGSAAIGLVQADVTRLAIRPRSVDRVLATTCLDSRAQRMAMHALAASALLDNGRYVYSVEFYDLESRLLDAPRVKRYTPGGMLFCSLDRRDALVETAPFFNRVRLEPLQAVLPFSARLPRRWRIATAIAAAKLPLLRECGRLLLICAEVPARDPEEGARALGHRIARSLYGWIYGSRVHRKVSS